ncbi:MAG: hypothetical protein Q3982_04100 [Phoenicibacter congonensis]|uniref:Uncharacterized protein n=1 Tax=Phoenicibacter congonensis TaxID=1944646 RepID=A0AA43RHH6_9ACTN|nr:hypothetical protein [Phoenicibacter congonensis]
MNNRKDEEATIAELASIFKKKIADGIRNYEDINGYSPSQICVVTYLSQEEYTKAAPKGFCRDASWYNRAVDRAVAAFKPENRSDGNPITYLMPYEVGRAIKEPDTIYVDLLGPKATKRAVGQ